MSWQHSNISSPPLWYGFLVILSLLLGQLFTCERFEPEALLLVQTDTVADVSLDHASVSGTILFVGEENIIQYGFCWSETVNPTTNLESKTQLGIRKTAGTFNSTVLALNPNSTYYIRAYATDPAGTVYGTQKSFTTLAPVAPSVTTSPIEDISIEGVRSGGEITSDGGSEVLVKGVCWSDQPNPSILNSLTENGSGNGVYESFITNLECGTPYYVRAYATNEVGTGYGQQLEFTTLDCPVGLPEVTTSPVSNITETSADGGGEVIQQGTSEVVARGICWSTERNPELSDPYSTNGAGVGVFSSSMTDLICGTTYYVRAYASNAVGTAYGQLDSFTTVNCQLLPPEVKTDPVINITRTEAQGGGNVINDGGAEVSAKGICWSKSPEPTLSANYTVSGKGTGSFIAQMTGLDCGTLYYVRAYATNSEGTSYGNQVEFNTEGCPVDPPSLTTTAVWNITLSSAQSGGDISRDGGASVTAKGICWSTFENPTISNEHTNEGGGIGEFTSVMTGLDCNTRYYVRAYATNSKGTSYGQQEDFRTSLCQNPPTVFTKEISDLRETTLTSGGEVTDDGNQPVTARGVCWSINPLPTIENDTTFDGSDLGLFDSQVSGLSPKTTYYLRAYATNSVGTGYGEELSFTTWDGSVTDFDGNTYSTTQIGEQIWMAENLKATTFPDGTPIQQVENTNSWAALSTDSKAYCYYNNNPINGNTYGVLYTWSAATNGVNSSMNPSGVQGVCPDGWHLPSDNEWKELEIFLGMSQSVADIFGSRGTDEGNQLKASYGWNNNGNGTDDYGFSTLPAGRRTHTGSFLEVGNNAYIWTSTEIYGTDAYYRGLYYGDTDVDRYEYRKIYGFSVRCIKD